MNDFECYEFKAFAIIMIFVFIRSWSKSKCHQDTSLHSDKVQLGMLSIYTEFLPFIFLLNVSKSGGKDRSSINYYNGFTCSSCVIVRVEGVIKRTVVSLLSKLTRTMIAQDEPLILLDSKLLDSIVVYICNYHP